jgi:ribose 5-phosphate isomerase RpiB
MPIKNIDGKCIGVMQLINKLKGVFDAECEEVLSSFSTQGKPNV